MRFCKLVKLIGLIILIGTPLVLLFGSTFAVIFIIGALIYLYDLDSEDNNLNP